MRVWRSLNRCLRRLGFCLLDMQSLSSQPHKKGYESIRYPFGFAYRKCRLAEGLKPAFGSAIRQQLRDKLNPEVAADQNSPNLFRQGELFRQRARRAD